MSFEVAALHATLGVRTEGMAEASRFTQQLSAAQEALERSAGSASAQVQVLRNELDEAVGTLQRFSNVTEFNNELLKGFGQTTQSLSAAISTAKTNADAATRAYEGHKAAIAAAQTEYRQLVAQAQAARKEHGSFSAEYRAAQQTVVAANKAIQQQIAQLSGLRIAASKATQELHNLKVAESLLVDDATFAAGQLNQAAQVEKATQRLNRATATRVTVQRQAARATQVSQTTLSGLVSAMRTGNIGSSVLAQGMQFLSSKIGLVAIGIGAAAIGLVALTAKFASTAAALNRANPEFVALTDSLGRLRGIDFTAMVEQLELLSNRFASFGASDAEGAAQAVAVLGQQLAFLRPGANDAGVAIQAISRSIENLNADQLRDFGINVSALEAELSRLADSGYGEAAQRAAIFAAIQDHVTRNSTEINAAMEREAGALSEIGAEFKRAFNEAARSDEVRNSVRGLTQAVKGLIASGKPLIGFFAQVAAVLIGVVDVAIRTVQASISGLLFAFSFLVRAGSIIPGVGDSFKALADTTLGWAKSLQEGALGQREANNEMRLGRDELFQFGAAAEEAKSKVEEFHDKVQGGFSVVGSIRQIGEAWDEMQEDLSPRTTFDFIEGIDRAMGFLAEHGTESLSVLRDRIKAFFDAGFINQAQFNELTRGLETIEGVAGPLQAEVERVESALGETQSQAQITAQTNNTQLTPSLSGIGSAAATAAGQVGDLTSALHSIPAQVSTSIVINGTNVTSDITGVGGLGDIANQGPGNGTSTSAERTASGLDRRGRPVHRAVPSVDRSAGSFFGKPPPGTPDFEAVADAFRKPETPSKSSGGAGSALASIEQIREFFRQMNQAIKIGVNNNIRFGTAGNTIPTGGISEFLNTRGGDLVQTINLRGVWDFADPAAKREVIRQLRELLGELSREDA